MLRELSVNIDENYDLKIAKFFLTIKNHEN